MNNHNKWHTLFKGYSLRLTSFLCVLAIIWIPHYKHFYIDRSLIDPNIVQSLVNAPSDELLTEIGSMPLGVSLEISRTQVVQAALEIVSGRLSTYAFGIKSLQLSGYPSDLQTGSPTLKLIMASLEVEQILIDAFEKTGQPIFLEHAAKRILQFAAYEGSQRTPKGFLWNDHAIAARIPVLAQFWRHTRHGSILNETDRIAVISLIERSGRLLAKNSHFTVRTNHGVMQNIALLQIGAAFPVLPEVARWRMLAADRLHQQLGFYISDEGMILEHSAGYHAFGTELLMLAVRLFSLNGMQPSNQLVESARKSLNLLRDLIRPDGTLPVLGNTFQNKLTRIPETNEKGTKPVYFWDPPFPLSLPGLRLLPLSGYALWWSQPSSDNPFPAQALIAWAKHDRHGHKHADEPSFHYWSNGINWITATGYWPYGLPGIEEAYGWTGSNAPHLLDESALSTRTVSLLHFANHGEGYFIDVARQGPGAFVVRRQIFQINSSNLLVVCHV